MFAKLSLWLPKLGVAVLLLVVTFAAGVVWQEGRQAKAITKAPAQVCTPVTTIIHDAAAAGQASAKAEDKVNHVHDRVTAAAASASAAIDAVPPSGACPAQPDPAGVAAWRAGIVGVRSAADPVQADVASADPTEAGGTLP